MHYPLFNPNVIPFSALPEPALSAYHELVTNTQAPPALIVNAMLAVMAYGCQGRVSVRRMSGLESPVTLSFLTIAESGERKSLLDRLLTRSIREMETSAREGYKKLAISREVADQIHTVKRNLLLRELRERTRAGEDVKHVETKLHALQATISKGGKEPRLIFGDTTIEAMLESLYDGWSSAIVLASEGGLFLQGYAMRRISVLNMLASGETITVDRKSSPSFVLSKAMLSTSVMVQPKVFQEFRLHRENQARGSGMWTRFFFARPVSTQGTRLLMPVSMTWGHVDAVNARIRELIEDPAQPGMLLNPVTRVLDLTPAALQAWMEFFNAVESELGPWGFLSDARDYGSRIAEQVARLAAIFHEFQGSEGAISLDSMQRAIALGKWYLQEFVSIFSENAPVDACVEDCFELHRFLNLMVIRSNRWMITKSSLRQRGPVRDRLRLQTALDYMFACGVLGTQMLERTIWIGLDSNSFGHNANWGKARLTPPLPTLPFVNLPYRY